MSILELPNEVLERIGAYLAPSDRTALACSCKRLYGARSWRDDATCPSVTLEDRDLVRAVGQLESSEQPVAEIVFRSTDLQREHIPRWKEFWRSLGPGIVSLEFRNCELSERVFVHVLDACPRLRRLAVDDCNGLLMSGKLLETQARGSDDVPRALPSLRSLELCNNRYLSDALFNRLVAYSAHLADVSLAGCQMSFHKGIFKRFYPSGVDGAPSESVLTFQNFVRFLERQSGKLKRLDLSGTAVDDDALGRVAGLPGLALHELRLAKCTQLTKKGIEALCTLQPDLRSLDVAQCRKLGDAAASLLAARTPRLRRLTASGVVGLTYDGASELAELDRLERLELSACSGIDSHALRRLLCSPSLRGLVALDLSSCALQEADVVEIVAHLTALRHLDLSHCAKGVTDDALQAIARHSQWLRTLRVAWCTAVTDFGLTGRHYVVPVLRRDYLPRIWEPANGTSLFEAYGRFPPKTPADVAPDSDSCPRGEPLHRLRGLRELDLGGCSEVSDVGLNVAVRFLELTKLDLSHCHRVTDGGLVAVAASNKSLETVVLSYCREITDDGLVSFAAHLPRLRHLDIKGCHKIGNINVDDLRKYCPYLRHLEASPSTKSPFQVGTPLARKKKPLKR